MQQLEIGNTVITTRGFVGTVINKVPKSIEISPDYEDYYLADTTPVRENVYQFTDGKTFKNLTEDVDFGITDWKYEVQFAKNTREFNVQSLRLFDKEYAVVEVEKDGVADTILVCPKNIKYPKDCVFKGIKFVKP